MVERWYPKGISSPEARLRYYAERFGTVEVDSTFYGIPKEEWARAWAERTPSGFTFHVKAFGMMTGHEVDSRALHPDLRDGGYRYEITSRGRVRDPDPRMVEHAFDLFVRSIQPLVDAGRMGGVLLQYPPWMTATDGTSRERGLSRIILAAELLAPLPVFVEFRHASWAAPATLERVTDLFDRHEITLVAVDAPQVASGTSMPPISVATGPHGYVRFHGRNRTTWDACTPSAADRFDYLYEPTELAEWRDRILSLADSTERTWVMFHNCRYDYAPVNARQMVEILGTSHTSGHVGQLEFDV
jgi:uncharacterized protein YecE (DUF72 family)